MTEIATTHFQRVLSARTVTNFPAGSLKEAAKLAFKRGLMGGATEGEAIAQFNQAFKDGLIVRCGRRAGKICRGYRTLTPAERSRLEAKAVGQHLPRLREKLPKGEARKIERRIARRTKQKEPVRSLRDIVASLYPVLELGPIADVDLRYPATTV